MRSLKWILFCTLFSGLTLSSDASAQQLATANAYPANSILETATSKAPADAPSAATLPTTKELLTRNDEVMGGAAAWSKVNYPQNKRHLSDRRSITNTKELRWRAAFASRNISIAAK